MSSAKGRKLNGEFFDPTRGYVCAENAQPLPDNIKLMIDKVKEAFPAISRNDVALVLQSCDYSLERALTSLTKDGGEDILRNWSTQGRKGKNGFVGSKSKRKRKNRKANAANKDEQSNYSKSTEEGPSRSTIDLLPNGLSDSIDRLEVTSQCSEKDVVLPNSDSGVVIGSECSSRKSSFSLPSKPEIPPPLSQPVPLVNGYDDTSSKVVDASGKQKTSLPAQDKDERQADEEAKKKGSAKEAMRRSVKDLQRSAVSIARFHLVLEEECESAEKKIKKAFGEFKKCMLEREQTLIEELKTLRTTAANTLNDRQTNAAVLKLRCDRIGGMTDAQLAELRADIKHFIGDRKVDEEIAKTSRFIGDHQSLLKVISEFGKVPPLKASYRARSSQSVSSSISTIDDRALPRVSSVVHDDVFREDATPSTVEPLETSTKLASLEYPPKNTKPLSASELREQADVHSKLKEVLDRQEKSKGIVRDEGGKVVSHLALSGIEDTRSKPLANKFVESTNRRRQHETAGRHSSKAPGRSRQSSQTSEDGENNHSGGFRPKHFAEKGREHTGKPRNFRRRDRNRQYEHREAPVWRREERGKDLDRRGMETNDRSDISDRRKENSISETNEDQVTSISIGRPMKGDGPSGRQINRLRGSLMRGDRENHNFRKDFARKKDESIKDINCNSVDASTLNHKENIQNTDGKSLPQRQKVNYPPGRRSHGFRGGNGAQGIAPMIKLDNNANGQVVAKGKASDDVRRVNEDGTHIFKQ